MPLFAIFKPVCWATRSRRACGWRAASSIYYSIWALFATHLQRDLTCRPAMVATPIAIANLVAFLASGFWGCLADIIGRRWSMIIPAFFGIFVAPIYLLTTDPLWIVAWLHPAGCFAGAIYGQNPSYLSERFPTEVRSPRAASATTRARSGAGSWRRFCTYFAINYRLGFGIPMMIGTCCGAALFIFALLLGPETKGTVMVADLDALIHEPGD